MAKKLENTDSLIILGGGEFANLIRKYDSSQSFSGEVTHYTAIDCMDIIAKLVNDKVDSTKLAYTLDEAVAISDEGYTPIFIVSDFLIEE
ncbi:MAG: delta 1-pyrroline-5-carboxylate synthetase, partial [Methanobrevibacter sp.]|nr:delta 1-pyrroline-5-carboxylate synthetase [Methanobrevibacter sp.]